MKKIYIFAAVLALLSLSLYAQVQTTKKVVKQTAQTEKVVTPQNGSMKAPNRATVTGSVTAADGTSTSTGYQWLPVYGYYFESAQTSQMIYRAEQLDGLQTGDKITSLTFYPNGNIAFSGGSITLSLGNTSISQFSSNSALNVSTTQVARVTTYPVSNGAWTITFTTPFTYTGENLLVQVNTTSGNYGRTYFYGADQSNYQSRNSYGSTNLFYFLPKVTLAYERNTDPEISASNNSVSMNATPGETATEVVNVTGANLTDGITATISGADASLFSVSPASLGTSGGSLTVTYSPTAVGTHTATLTLSSTGAQDVTITLNGLCEKVETICDGTDQNNYLPIFGYWYDSKQINQMIYPASRLTNLVGAKITSMTFYSPHIYFSGGAFIVNMGTTTQASFSSVARNTADLTTTVVTGMAAPTAGGTELTITFDAPFEYNGGNLLVDFEVVSSGSYGNSETYFYGVSQTGGGFYSRGSSTDANGVYTSSNAIQDFLPKVTFTYEETGPKHDLGIALSAPASAGAGSTVNVTATVTNNGDFAENGYTVTVTDGTNIVTITATEELPVGQSAEFTVQMPTSANDAGQTVNYTATVACTDDAVASNNSASASTSLINLPPPVNVVATPNGTNATVTWEAPNIASVSQTLTWDFEEESDFNAFTLVDADGDGYNWSYFNDSQAVTNSGTGVATSESYVNTSSTSGTALDPDNWMISPEVTLGGNLSFYACGQDPDWPSENFAVYYCVGSYSSTSDFVKIADYTATATMTEIPIDLSQYDGQGYFAIRHYNMTGNDMYRLNIDDINYEVNIQGQQPTSYNVYLDGTLVGSVNANDPLSYDFSNLAEGNHQCAISAVYTAGESAQVPATFTIAAATPTIEISPATQTISDAAAATLTVTGTDIESNINVSAGNNWSLNPTSLSNTGGNVSVSYTGRDLSATTTVTATAANDNNVSATATVNYVADVYIVGNFGNGWDFNNGTQMTYNNGTYTTTITVDAGNYILFARLLGNTNPWNTRDVFGPNSSGDWGMQGDSYGGNIDLNDDDPIYFPEGGTYRITINATNGTFTITRVSESQTATPTIDYTVSDEYVTITATGDGTVTLNVPGYDPVSDEGEVSITIPRGYASNTITVTATAKEDGKEESDPATAQIEIPAGSDWVEMDGTYDNPNDLLSFLKDGEDIALIDQFRVSTLNNNHPDHYTYTLRQTVNGETKTSTPVTIPVYKTNSTMKGFYTLNQVLGDTDMALKDGVINSEMDYDVAPSEHMYYYGLFRGDMNADYPVIDNQHRVSQLQQYNEKVGEQVLHYFTETYLTGVAPRYDHIGNQQVAILDTNYVQGAYDDELAYVPVIWTYGLSTARGDGKDNTYGSDIKRETLGKVEATITGESTYLDNGTWYVGETKYCVFHPTITVTGYLPQAPLYRVDYNDGDYAEYEPYMCRAWCTTEGIHDFVKDSDGHLVDNGELTVPYWLGDATFGSSLTTTIGGEWTHGDERDQWSFGLPVGTEPDEVTYIIRFYYKKVVEEANTGSKLRDGGDSAEYFIVQTEGDVDVQNWDVTGLNEFLNGVVPVSVTYVNPQGMQSSRPFDGVNIVVTRYSDGTTRTTKIIR